jgi:hypothetical protein
MNKSVLKSKYEVKNENWLNQPRFNSSPI